MRIRANSSNSVAVCNGKRALTLPLEPCQLHHDFRRPTAILQALIPDPKVSWIDAEPEIGLRDREAKEVENAETGNQFHFVAFELAGGCADALTPACFHAHFIEPWLI